jgi:hypothetical protein
MTADTETSNPFLGQVRAVHYVVMKVRDATYYGQAEAFAATKLEQWNGKEWVLVWDYQP